MSVVQKVHWKLIQLAPKVENVMFVLDCFAF